MKIKNWDAYLWDCLEIMDNLIEQWIQVDAIITDPPYWTTACKRDQVIPFDKMRERLNKLIKPNGAIVLTASQPFTSALVMSNIKMFKYEWIWDKHIPRGFANAKIMPMSKHENVLVFGTGKLKYNPEMILRDKPVTVKNYSKKDKDSAYKLNIDGDSGKSYTYTHKSPDTIIVWKWEANAGKVHPTQKPVALIEYLIKTYTNEWELVLDFTAWSFTTAIACENTNRKRVCIEKDEWYYNIWIERVNGDTK